MSRRIKNIDLIINGKIIINNKIKKFNMFKSRKYARFIRKREISIHKIDDIEILSLKKHIKKCKGISLLDVLFFFFCLIIFSVIKPYLNIDFYSNIVFKYRKYNIGEKVKYKNTNWYVINNSSTDTDLLVLLLEGELDSNQDGVLNYNDRVKYSNEIIDNLNSIYSNSRLLTSYEYINIRDEMNFGYFWDNDNFLAGKSLYDWWVNTNDPNKLYSVTESGCFKENNIDSINYIRPVIEISKLDFKKN